MYFCHSRTGSFQLISELLQSSPKWDLSLQSVLFTIVRSVFLTCYLGHVVPFLNVHGAWILHADGTQTLKSVFSSPSLLPFQAHIWNLPFENSLLLIWIQAEHSFPDDSQTVCDTWALSIPLRMLMPGAFHGHCTKSHGSHLNPVWLRKFFRSCFSICFKPPHHLTFLGSQSTWLSLSTFSFDFVPSFIQ